MNLRNFHFVFIACSSALAIFFGAWILNSSSLAGGARLGGALGAFAIGLALIAYEAWFVRYSGRRQ